MPLQYDKKFQKKITVNENETNFWDHQKRLPKMDITSQYFHMKNSLSRIDASSAMRRRMRLPMRRRMRRRRFGLW